MPVGDRPYDGDRHVVERERDAEDRDGHDDGKVRDDEAKEVRGDDDAPSTARVRRDT